MVAQNLDQWVAQQENIVETLRAQGGNFEDNFPVVPNEYTNWIDEIRASVESAALADLSHHMTAVHLEGPDTIRLLKDLCINDFDNFEVGQAKQIVMCNHNGHVMGDGPLLRLGKEEFFGPGIHATKWLQFNLETNDYDVMAEIEPPTPMLSGNPQEFVFQVQGPKSYDVLDKLTDDDFREIGFYRFDDITLAGREIRAFGHGMSPEAGFEFHGPYEYAAELREAIVDAGEEFGLRELGSKTYVANSVRLGWIPPFMKPVYNIPEMKEYRQWADGEKEQAYGKFSQEYNTDSELKHTFESSFSIEGSYDSDDISDYYLNPVELGYGKLVDLSHDFVGKEAVERSLTDPDRTLVSLMWDDDDVSRVNNSLYRDGENYKFMDNLPRLGWARQPYDKVTRNGETVGISHSRSFEWDLRGIVSLCTIDVEYSEPGTEVTLVWGEPDGESPNPRIEDHAQTEIRTEVQPAPYITDRRRSN